MTRDEMIEAFAGVIVYVLDPHGTDDGEHVARQAIHALEALRALPRVPEGYVLVPKEVMDAAERMAIPLDETRLSGVTARQDKRCSDLILSFLRSIAATQPREVDVDELAQFIRTTDGNHTMGAGALAESIVGFLMQRRARGEEM